jgi:nitronate monooxygenase
VRGIEPVAVIVDRLVKEYDTAAARPRFAAAEGVPA